MAYARLHANAIGTVITYLEMIEPPVGSPIASEELRMVRLETPSIKTYRNLFVNVGQHWLWFDPLEAAEADLRTYLNRDDVEVYAVQDQAQRDVGILELDLRTAGECKIAFLGLVPEMIGKGHGRWLLDQAKEKGWREGVKRLHLNTCTLDHPRALQAYMAAGFKPYARALRTFFDPRLRGLLPPEAAPHLPTIQANSGGGRGR